jgi:hypothetical protein
MLLASFGTDRFVHGRGIQNLRSAIGGSLVGLALWLALAATAEAAPAVPPGASTASVTEIDKAIIVDCFLGRGTVRKVGGAMGVRAVPGQRVRISKLECDARGGESILYDAADPATAIQLWSAPAAAGDKDAQNRLGQIYELGIGRDPDYAEAAKWYRRAADAGHRAAAINLASLYDRGEGVPKDMAKAAQYYGLAQPGTGSAAGSGELKEAKQRLDASQRRIAELEAALLMAKGAGQPSAAVAAELASAQKSLDDLLAPGEIRPKLTGLVMEVGGEAGNRPVITVLDPNIVATRGSADVKLGGEIKIKDVVGRVRAKNGIADIRINNAPANADRFGFFSTSLPVDKAGTRVEIVAVDRAGERETLSFVMHPGSWPERVGVPGRIDAPSLVFGNYYALVIGNRHYVDRGWSELPNAESDARAIAEVLQKKYAFKRVQLVIDGTYEQILNAINDYAKSLAPTDNLLIYYAGHGQLDLGKRGYWIPTDAETERNTKWILNVQITDLLLKSTARKILVVSDSCYSGAMTAAENGAVPTIRTGLPDAQRISVAKGMVDAVSRVMLTSGALSPVAEGGGGGHSLFARAFLDVLDANNGVLEGYQLFAALEARVMHASQGRYRDQTPLYAAIQHAGHEGGDFFFVAAPMN